MHNIENTRPATAKPVVKPTKGQWFLYRVAGKQTKFWGIATNDGSTFANGIYATRVSTGETVFVKYSDVVRVGETGEKITITHA